MTINSFDWRLGQDSHSIPLSFPSSKLDKNLYAI
jgi:hypothetical protein